MSRASENVYVAEITYAVRSPELESRMSSTGALKIVFFFLSSGVAWVSPCSSSSRPTATAST
ncbi:hypothetical protein A3L22_28020 [Streptomyces griseus subsp. griseus]|nr:hypothetical protein A3L22_28020 [Streptomyces griseus subsp. griseus]